MKWRTLILIGLVWWLAGCSTQRVAPHVSLTTAVPFEQASQQVAESLLKGIKYNQGLLRYIYARPNIAVEPFSDAYTHEELLAGQKMPGIFKAAEQRYPTGNIVAFSSDAAKNSKYLIEGTFALEHPGQGQTGKQYVIRAVARHLGTGRIIASSDVWVKGNIPGYEATPEFRDIPAYLDYDRKPKPLPEIRLHDNIEARALLADAGNAYANKEYAKAERIYEDVRQRKNDQALRSQAGLYITKLRMGQKQQAAEAFGQLLNLSFQKSDTLTLKILFKVDSEQFYGGNLVNEQYSLWLQKIASYLQQHHSCMVVTGHSSHTGTAEYNQSLSLQRAESIRSLLNSLGANNITAKGKGFSENIIGSGTDDARDALDRRVEFRTYACHSADAREQVLPGSGGAIHIRKSSWQD